MAVFFLEFYFPVSLWHRFCLPVQEKQSTASKILFPSKSYGDPAFHSGGHTVDAVISEYMEIEIYLKFIGKFEIPIPEPTQEELAAEEAAKQAAENPPVATPSETETEVQEPEKKPLY